MFGACSPTAKSGPGRVAIFRTSPIVRELISFYHEPEGIAVELGQATRTTNVAPAVAFDTTNHCHVHNNKWKVENYRTLVFDVVLRELSNRK